MAQVNCERTDVAQTPVKRALPIVDYVLAIVFAAISIVVVKGFAEGQISWRITGQYFFFKTILNGVLMTVIMAITAKMFSIVIGIVSALALLSNRSVLKAIATAYVWLFRGTPVLLQLLIWFNLALAFPTISLFGFGEWRTVDVMTPFFATLLGLGLNQGAYTAEVVRAGIISVDQGQVEAAKSIGMTRSLTLRRIVMPQAMRVIIPPLGNETISMLKLTSVASVIQFEEVLRNAEGIYYANARTIELLFVAAGWYLILVTIFSVAQKMLERHFSRAYQAGDEASRTPRKENVA